MPAKSVNYTTKGLPPPPDVSVTTIPMVGLLVDVYGLDELPALPHKTPVTCLWLLHPRLRTRQRMRDIASRVLHAWHQSPKAASHGMIALAFDMPNHGTRLVSETANDAWDAGNTTHAMDMLGMVKGGWKDMSGLMDVAEGYLNLGGRKASISIVGNTCLGWSLGGHAAWQAWVGEPRLDAVVVVVGCPDFMGLMSDRAKQSNLDCGDAFIGSKYFPTDLVHSCRQVDPKAVLFGLMPLPSSLPLSSQEKGRLGSVLESHRNKKLLLLSGADDPLVPYANARPLIKVLEGVGGLSLKDKVYEGVGHWFSADMVGDAVDFLVRAVEEGPKTVVATETDAAKI